MFVAIHLSLHLILPLICALFFYKNNFKYAYWLMLLTMLVDIDHLLATPIFDPNRCSINFHPLHSYIAIAFYVALFFISKTRIISLGLMIHMALDALDCKINEVL